MAARTRLDSRSSEDAAIQHCSPYLPGRFQASNRPSRCNIRPTTSNFLYMPRRCVSARERFAASVTLIREGQGMSGDELARIAGVSRNTVYLIENTSSNVQLGTVCKLARALQTDPSAFFSNDKYRAPTVLRLGNLQRVVARNVRAHRVRQEISQNQMNRDLAMAPGYLGVIERKAPDLSLDVLEKIAFYLACPLDEMLLDSKRRLIR